MTVRICVARNPDARVWAMALAVASAACVPGVLRAQAGGDAGASADTSAVQRASVALTQTTPQPITLCIVPGSGTAYRIGGPGLPSQCLAATHTPLTLNVMGPQGLQGLTGAKGDTGATGPVGETGAKGDSGAMGPKGEAGAAGPPGVVGPQGEVGPAGPAGAAGDAGPAGQPGAAGEVGPIGPIGATGPAGPPGDAGTAGAAGAAGADGAAGAPGAPGAPGPPGAPGAEGPQGMQGVAGAPGTTDHSALTNLDTDSHPQYLIAGQRSALDGFSVSGTMYQGAEAPTGAGTRMVWNPRKAAFRAGAVNGNEWDDAEVGYWSTAFGNNSWAPGNASFAGGMNSRAGGSESLAMGIGADAAGRGSVAFSGSAWGIHAFAVGSGSEADGEGAIAMGQGTKASGPFSVSIGQGNANGARSMNIGTNNNADGEQSIILGHGATNAFAGSIVLSAQTSSGSRVYATAENQLAARAIGGFVFWTDNDMNEGVTLMPGGGSWSIISDRNRKTGFRSVDGEWLLGKLRTVPVTSWSYKAQDASVHHIGPMAQDWHRAFGLSPDSTSINSGDLGGVTLAGVQALDARTSVSLQRIAQNEERIAVLERQVQQLMDELRASRENIRRE